LPGFIEAHAHLPTLPKVRADTLKTHAFDQPTPRVFSAGRIINGPRWLDGGPLFLSVTSADETTELVAEIVAAGADPLADIANTTSIEMVFRAGQRVEF
jgi:hypothetical protein